MTFTEVERKIGEKARQAAEFYDKINKEVEGDEGAAISFLEFTVELLLNGLSKELLLQFDDKTSSIDA